MVSIDSEHAPRIALEHTVSAIASARRAMLADRYAVNSFTVEWRWLTELGSIEEEWRELAGRALEPNVFYEPAFARAATAVFGRGVGAVLVWSGTQPRKLLGFFPARIARRRYGLALPVLVGWTHPYAPLGTPLVEREAAEPVIAAWLSHLADNPQLPGLVLLPLIAEHGAFAATLDAILRRTQMPVADFARHSRALLEPGPDRQDYVERTLSPHRLRELRRNYRRLADIGALLFSAAAEPAVVGRAIEDFFALEASGWKGKAGTAAAIDGTVQNFFKTAVYALAAEAKVAICRLLLDGRPIAAAVTLRSGDTAWYWKTAYDEKLARHAPGVLLTVTLTERLAEEPGISRTDSCAAPGTAMMDEVWGERLALCDRLIAVKPQAPFARGRRLETLRGKAVTTAKALRARLRRNR